MYFHFKIVSLCFIFILYSSGTTTDEYTTIANEFAQKDKSNLLTVNEKAKQDMFLNKNHNDENSACSNDIEGKGYFRHPVEILGPKFSDKYLVHLCELHLYTYAEELSKVKFTPRGKKSCLEVCDQYRKNMVVDGVIEVQLLHSYCNYIGTASGDNEIGLDRTCSCPYRVRCQSRARLITYTFEPNCLGYIKVAVYESKFHRYVT
ncbi:uncharacterized protein LOC126898986 [Daktulosphaira vitifoliae]|uniref:uncharacterized protein LOC126898986 n=1 Tax=Daktulosphaira vitifoliae TaxID=58002 RepID=UPI0021AA68C5|nr:uncharacterized protein LOC126898986 [Daktulosphaira vitifoliae]